MNIVNEATDLINCLASIIDDSKEGAGYGGILRITIDGDLGCQVQVDTPEFLSYFPETNYDAKLETFDEFPYYLAIEIEGVKFFTVFCHQELETLKKSHPKHYEYISMAVLV